MAGVGDRSAHNMAAPAASTTLPPAVTVADAIPLPRCDGIVDFSDYSLPLLGVSLVGLIIGLVYAFFGYRFFKSVLFLTGLLFGAGVIYLVCEKERVLPTLGNVGVALIAGILFGLITMLVEYVGLFMTGFLTGQLVGAALLLCLHAFALVNTVWITIAVQFVAGLALAQVTLVFQRIAMIGGTALIGGALVMASMDYLGQRLASVMYVWDVMNIRAPPIAAVCWYSWTIIALWPLVFVVAAVVQFRFTAVGYSHKAGYRLSRKDAHRSSAQRLTVSEDGRRRTVATTRDLQSVRVKETRPPTPEPDPPYQPKSFRLLYQARRNHGDVICQFFFYHSVVIRELYGKFEATGTRAVFYIVQRLYCNDRFGFDFLQTTTAVQLANGQFLSVQ